MYYCKLWCGVALQGPITQVQLCEWVAVSTVATVLDSNQTSEIRGWHLDLRWFDAQLGSTMMQGKKIGGRTKYSRITIVASDIADYYSSIRLL